VRVYDAIAAQDGEASAKAMHELVELAHEDTHSAMKVGSHWLPRHQLEDLDLRTPAVNSAWALPNRIGFERATTVFRSLIRRPAAPLKIGPGHAR
jgi:hypothetical protein